MKRKLIIILILIVLAILVGFLILRTIYYANHPLPSQRTIALGESIAVYPNATKWEIKTTRGGCWLSECAEPIYYIFFDTSDSQSEVLDFYLTELYLKFSRKPSEHRINEFRNGTFNIAQLVVFKNSSNCSVQLNNFYQGTPDKDKYGRGQYSFDLRCRGDFKR